MGVLIPESEYKLIPMRALRGCEIEVKFNPFAFFTTGMKDDATKT